MDNQSNRDVDKCLRIVVMGVSGCGKSEIGRRLAARIGVDYVEGDDFHPPENIAKMKSGTPLDDKDRQGWLRLLRDLLRQAVATRRGIILTCSALKRSYRDLLRQGDPGLIFVHLRGDRELIAQRMATRTGHFMPYALHDSQFVALEPLGEEERGVTVDITLEPDKLVDEIVQRLANLEQS